MQVTKGSVINNGGNAKTGLMPTVGVGLALLNLGIYCCKCDENGCRRAEPCYNTMQPGSTCVVDGFLFSNCTRTGRSNCR